MLGLPCFFLLLRKIPSVSSAWPYVCHILVGQVPFAQRESDSTFILAQELVTMCLAKYIVTIHLDSLHPALGHQKDRCLLLVFVVFFFSPEFFSYR